ncbi:flavin reductase [Paucihalobacter ruber]|uniref:Flavin reductase n=1 Tax=Paucihalobacter ruber TaxID=2567861 RepID=A0A506PJC9_9FLAO|nr:flavin reductase family protein [Paucihalobacter ruber]TPV33207.1 flavin reductase [Paucihalobacter ruber]
MKQFNSDDIDQLHHLYRINLINSCSGYKSANLIGTKSQDGYSNVAVFSSVTHLGSNPGLLGFFLRPTTVMRHTYDNIKSTGFFTINHIHENILEEAHHTSAKYAKEVSEFDVTALNQIYRDNFHAPFVGGCPVQLAMEFVEEHPIPANNTILVVGKIVHLYVDEDLLHNDGFIDLSKAKVAAINGLDAYAVPNAHLRLEYQRPKDGYARRED